MSAKSTISVVTPSFNQGMFIADCLESIARHRDPAVEHIVVDGGSTDQTLDFLSMRHDVIWSSEPDRGQSDAINKGIRAAKGEWILWLNADDYMLGGAIDAARAAIAKEPKALVVYGDYFLVDREGRFVRLASLASGINRYKRYFSNVPSSGTFFHVDLFRKYGLWLDTELRIIMDNDLFARMDALQIKFVKADGIISAFRVHGANASLSRHFMAPEEAERRWQVHKREWLYSLRKVILPGLHDDELRFRYWQLVRKAFHYKNRFDRLITGCYLRNAIAGFALKGRKIAPADPIGRATGFNFFGVRDRS